METHRLMGAPISQGGLPLPRIPMHTWSQDPREGKAFLLLFIWLAAHSPYWAWYLHLAKARRELVKREMANLYWVLPACHMPLQGWACPDTFNPHNNLMRQVLSLAPHCNWGKAAQRGTGSCLLPHSQERGAEIWTWQPGPGVHTLNRVHSSLCSAHSKAVVHYLLGIDFLLLLFWLFFPLTCFLLAPFQGSILTFMFF